VDKGRECRVQNEHDQAGGCSLVQRSSGGSSLARGCGCGSSLVPRYSGGSSLARGCGCGSSLDKGQQLDAVIPPLAAASAAAAKRRMLPSRGGGQQKVHRPWALSEVEALVAGVAQYGRGQWADIKSLKTEGVGVSLCARSAVDLKDKWRNVLRIAMQSAPHKRREATDLPLHLLVRVRQLALQKGVPRHEGDGGENDSNDGGDSYQDSGGDGDCRRDCDIGTGNDSEDARGADEDGGAGETGVCTGGGGEVSRSGGGASKGARRSTHHSPWTLGESQALVDAVARGGGCRWTVITRLRVPALSRRTAMDLKVRPSPHTQIPPLHHWMNP